MDGSGFFFADPDPDCEKPGSGSFRFLLYFTLKLPTKI